MVDFNFVYMKIMQCVAFTKKKILWCKLYEKNYIDNNRDACNKMNVLLTNVFALFTNGFLLMTYLYVKKKTMLIPIERDYCERTIYERICVFYEQVFINDNIIKIKISLKTEGKMDEKASIIL